MLITSKVSCLVLLLVSLSSAKAEDRFQHPPILYSKSTSNPRDSTANQDGSARLLEEGKKVGPKVIFAAAAPSASITGCDDDDDDARYRSSGLIKRPIG